MSPKNDTPGQMASGADPFGPLNRKVRWQARLLRWQRSLLRPFRPRRIQPDRQGPPNLFLVGIDTLRADHLGCHSYHRPTSPCLDGLAASGTRFGDVTAPAPWTLPSFSSALSGVMPGLHGAFLPGSPRNMDTQPPGRLSEDIPTLASHLRGQGYRTAAFYSNQFFAFGLAESFGEHVYLNLPAEDLLSAATDWVGRHADQPFFCFVLLNDPHEPTTPPVNDLASFLPELQSLGAPADPGSLAAYARWGEDPALHLGKTGGADEHAVRSARAIKMALYDATIHYVDRCLGDLAAWLTEVGLSGSTLVSVFSDHGEEFLDHEGFSRLWDHDPRGIHGIGHGHTMFQELLHVPWISWGPGVPVGVRSRAPVSLCDLPFTLCDWLGVPPLQPTLPPDGFAAHLVGRSQATGVEAGDQEERLILAEAIAYGPDLVALRRGRWKLIAHRDGRALALYDLLGSPEEDRDLTQANPQVVAALLEELKKWRESGLGAGGEGKGSGSWDDLKDTVRQRLKDLGYSE